MMQKHNLYQFMSWKPSYEEETDTLTMPRTSYFSENYGAHGRRISTQFHNLIFNNIVKVKKMPHMKLTLSNIVKRKNYRQKL